MLRRPLLAACVVALALAVSACGGSGDEGSATAPAAGGQVADLESADDLRRAFATADGSPRLVLLLAPT